MKVSGPERSKFKAALVRNWNQTNKSDRKEVLFEHLRTSAWFFDLQKRDEIVFMQFVSWYLENDLPQLEVKDLIKHFEDKLK